MKSKLLIFLLTVSLTTIFSACTSVETAPMEEISIDDGYKTTDKEVVITDADLQNKKTLVSNSKESVEGGKRTLDDKSGVEILIDGFGNKTETRYFNNHPRLRFIILRTSVKGKKEVTVYGYGSDTKTLYDLGENALTASADEIANSAKLYATRSSSEVYNFMKKTKSEKSSEKPLPNSRISKTDSQIEQPQTDVQPESSVNNESSENEKL